MGIRIPVCRGVRKCPTARELNWSPLDASWDERLMSSELPVVKSASILVHRTLPGFSNYRVPVSSLDRGRLVRAFISSRPTRPCG